MLGMCHNSQSHQESRPLGGGSNFRGMRRAIHLYSQPIRFVTVDPENAQSDGKSVNRGVPVDLWTSGVGPSHGPEVAILGEREWVNVCALLK